MGRLTEGRTLGGENRPVDVNGLIPSGGEVISTGTGGAVRDPNFGRKMSRFNIF